jgi:signal transduction histidine kinase
MTEIHDRRRLLVVKTGRESDTHVRVTVQDTGTGIDPHDAERFFEPFYTTKSGGMGIGLSVSRSIIESHRGRICAQPNDGPGATFGFSLPCHPSPSIAGTYDYKDRSPALCTTPLGN